MDDNQIRKIKVRRNLQQRIDELKRQISDENDMDFEMHLRTIRELQAILRRQG